jgi:N-acetylmuramoyl-L-alanine amidase
MEPEMVATNVAQTAPPVPAPAPAQPPTNAPAVAVAVQPPPVNQPQFNSAETWVPLERWCRLNGFTSPFRASSDASPAFSFASTNGTMVLRVGSQLARWNGAEYHLGFAPQLIGGQFFIHRLDIQKNFLPLVESAFHNHTNRTIVIDPGHGGSDSGTRSAFDGHYEKDYVLDWALRLQELLVRNGWTVWLTRTGDYNVSLNNRVAFAEQHNAGLFLSLHLNSAFPDREQSGLETYCLTPTGMPSNLTRGFRDNAALAFPNNRFDAENMQYAAELHRAILGVNGHGDRGVRRARFLSVLQGQNRPAVLIEGGYLSNPHEAGRIADPAYRQKMAEAVARALLEDAGMGLKLASQTPAPAPAPPVVDGKAN